MKKLAGFVVILTAVILGSYYGMGIITERTLKKNMAVIDQANGMSVALVQYHRGFCRSTALLNWSVKVPPRSVKNTEGVVVTIPEEQFSVQIPLDIYHGPVMFVDSRPMFGLGYARSHVVLPQPWAQQFTKNYTPESTMPAANLSIFVNYLNDSSLEVMMPAFKMVSKEGISTFEWLGMSSDTKISPYKNRVKGRVMIEGVIFQKDRLKTSMGKLSSDFDLHRTPLNMYLGNADIVSSTLVVMQDDKKILDVEKWNVHATSDVENGLFGSRLNVSLDRLSTADKIYGPVSLQVSLNNLDAEVLAKINRQMNEMQQGGTDADRQKALLMLMPELSRLFNKGARLEVSDLSVTMPEGLIKGNLQVSLPVEGVDNPFQLIQKMQGQGKFVFSQAVLKQVMNDLAKESLQKQAVLEASMPPAETGTVANSTPTPAEDVAKKPENTVMPASEPVAAASSAQPVSEAIAPTPVVVTQEAIEKLANEKLANMVESGLLLQQGSDYVVEFKLAEGKLDVNGKPFNSAMLNF
jgi:uncharacterized protein YdgA (DUF945 family)